MLHEQLKEIDQSTDRIRKLVGDERPVLRNPEMPEMTIPEIMREMKKSLVRIEEIANEMKREVTRG